MTDFEESGGPILRAVSSDSSSDVTIWYIRPLDDSYEGVREVAGERPAGPTYISDEELESIVRAADELYWVPAARYRQVIEDAQ